MAKTKLAHDEQAFFDAFIRRNRTWIRRHYLRHRGGSGSAPHSHHPIHDVTLRQDARQLSIAQYRQGADIVLHHEPRSIQHRARSLDGIQLAVLHEIAKSGHGNSFATPNLKKGTAHGRAYGWGILYHSLSGETTSEQGNEAKGTSAGSPVSHFLLREAGLIS